MNDDMTERRQFKADAPALRPMSAWWRAWAIHAGLTSEACDRGEVCLNEAVGNIIQHGAIPDERAVDVVLERSPGAVRVTVIDSGDDFNPLDRPLVAFPPTLESAAGGGLGIPLMRLSADEVSYRRENGQNRLTFYFQL